MSSDDFNPYVAPQTTYQPGEQFRRPLSSAIVAAAQLANYCVLVFWGMALLPYLVLGGFVLLLEGLPDVRSDEFILMVLALVSVPVCGWLAREEIRCFRTPTVDRERSLSRRAMLMTAAPVLMSTFWFYEYLAFGASSVNSTPALWAAAFSFIWFASSAYRYVRVARLSAA